MYIVLYLENDNFGMVQLYHFIRNIRRKYLQKLSCHDNFWPKDLILVKLEVIMTQLHQKTVSYRTHAILPFSFLKKSANLGENGWL